MLTTHTGPGYPSPLRGEIERLVALRDQVLAGAEEIKQLDPDSWRGIASDRFGEFRVRLGKRWLTIGDLCDRAIDALASYQDSLVDVRARMAANELPYGWRQELDPVAHAVARQLHWINDELAELRSLFDAPAPKVAQTTPPPLGPVWNSAPPPDPEVAAELGRPGDESYTRDMQDVAGQLLHAQFNEIDLLLDDSKPP